MCDHFGVGLGSKAMSLFSQLLLERDVILDDPVVHYDDFSGAIAMRMRVLFRRTTVRGPTGVADSVSPIQRLQPNNFFQVAQFTLGLPNLQTVAIAAYRNPRGVIPAVFQTPQTLDNDRDNPLLADVSHDSAHCRRLLSVCGEVSSKHCCVEPESCQTALLFNPIAKLFDYRIGQDFPRNATDFALRLRPIQSAIQRQLEKFPLPHVLQPVVTHLMKRSLDGLALRIQDAPLQRNIHVCFHGDDSLYGNRAAHPTNSVTKVVTVSNTYFGLPNRLPKGTPEQDSSYYTVSLGDHSANQ